MPTPAWAPATLYPPGTLRRPRTQQGGVSTAITNASFETGDATGWNLDPGVSVAPGGVGGTPSARFTDTGGARRIVHDPVPCIPGTTINASCIYGQGSADSGHNTGRVILQWLDSLGAIIREDLGTLVSNSNGGWFKTSSVAGSAPAGTVEVAIGCLAIRDRSEVSIADNFAWDYAVAQPPSGLVFRAVQPETGYSDTTEPTWPTVVGVQVVDNEVIWEAVVASRVVWQASPILKSGPTEPTWPDVPGTTVADNTISWMAVTREVTQAPESKIVVIGASKVFAGDDDIDRYSATVNPLDWTTEADAGYLGTGLQQYGANPIAAQGLYRGNLVVFNAEAFQMWQIDEDPANMVLLDALPLGSTRHHALCPIGDELLFLSSRGVRSIGVAAGSTNLASADVGKPIDELVQAAVAIADATGIEPLALYLPAAGQYWLVLNHADGAVAFVFTMNGSSKSWSRYTIPFQVDDWVIKGDVLYLRSADSIFRLDIDEAQDVLEEGGVPVDVQGTIWWPYLDLGNPGTNKRVIGFDIVSDGEPEIEFGHDQTNSLAFTDPYPIPADTVPGMMIPMPITAPSISVRVTFSGGEPWHFRALNLYLSDDRMAA